MKLRQIALSIAAASALATAAPSFAQSDIVVAPAPYLAPTTPDVVVVPAQPDVVVVPATPAPAAPAIVVVPDTSAIVTDQGGMTPQERRDTSGTADRATGTITAPGYMGPHDSKGQ